MLSESKVWILPSNPGFFTAAVSTGGGALSASAFAVTGVRFYHLTVSVDCDRMAGFFLQTHAQPQKCRMRADDQRDQANRAETHHLNGSRAAEVMSESAGE